MKFKVKLGVFFAFSMIIPIIYLTIRFKLISGTKTQLSIWFFIVLLIFFGVLAVFIKYYLDGMKTKYSFLKQLLEGFVKVIMPLGIVLIGFIFFKSKLEWITSNINKVIEAFVVLLLCETIAVIINPLPKWAFDNKVDGIVAITDKILKKEKTE